ncbi:TatD family deoxyribonuclease [Candidatus Kaiserbacteria bacterium]|nr:TatD family deoxyribonuclease [Candidatus Kaiserbacteria bacterium]
MRLFDSHCQLQFEQYDADRDAVLARMEEKGMGALVIGTDLDMSRKGLELAKQHDFLWASVGVHPTQDEVFDADKYEELAGDPKVVAIGECGLDYFRVERSEAQKENFLAHITLANKVQKPLIVHCREAHDDCSSVLQNTAIAVPVVMHFFTGSGELAQKFLDLGCYLSFPGPITYTDMYDDSIRVCPLDKMLIETDAPFAAPVPFRGKRNEPVYVEYVAIKIAQVKGVPVEEVTAATMANAQKIFRLPAGEASLQS